MHHGLGASQPITVVAIPGSLGTVMSHAHHGIPGPGALFGVSVSGR